MNGDVCTLTERGQISMPASLRRKMHLKAGQKLRWESVSETEIFYSLSLKICGVRVLRFSCQ